jgi:hypothetical protein
VIVVVPGDPEAGAELGEGGEGVDFEGGAFAGDDAEVVAGAFEEAIGVERPADLVEGGTLYEVALIVAVSFLSQAGIRG